MRRTHFGRCAHFRFLENVIGGIFLRRRVLYPLSYGDMGKSGFPPCAVRAGRRFSMARSVPLVKRKYGVLWGAQVVCRPLGAQDGHAPDDPMRRPPGRAGNNRAMGKCIYDKSHGLWYAWQGDDVLRKAENAFNWAQK